MPSGGVGDFALDIAQESINHLWGDSPDVPWYPSLPKSLIRKENNQSLKVFGDVNALYN
jgi:hypothetical protein